MRREKIVGNEIKRKEEKKEKLKKKKENAKVRATVENRHGENRGDNDATIRSIRRRICVSDLSINYYYF